jgi:hypothetical protein
MRNHLLYFGVLSAALSTPFGMASLRAQEPASATQTEALAVLPDAPQPQQQTATPEQPQQAGTSSSSSQTGSQTGIQAGTEQAPAPNSGQSSSQQANQQPNQQTDQDQHQKAEQQIKVQEQQRVLGVVPMFNTTYLGEKTVPLTAGQKIKLAFRSSIDPVAFGEAFLVAGYHEANDDYGGFGWGAEGYFKMSGAAYLDSFDGTMLGNGVFPALLHQDPRYYRLGHGTTMHRILYAASTSFICKSDNGKWQPNFSNVGGNIAAGAISNLYYPSKYTSGWSQTIGDGMLNTVVGMFGGVFQEFWPDISRKFLHQDPTQGAQQLQGAGSDQ